MRVTRLSYGLHVLISKYKIQFEESQLRYPA
jgi:hypothetical protein